MNRRKFLKFAAGGVAGIIGSYPIFIERYIVQINRYRIPVPNLPKSFERFTIVHLADFHYGFLVPYRFIQKVISRANDIPRDLIVCTGDYIHERDSSKQIDTIWPLLSTLTAPYGVVSILGNNDHWADTDRSIYWLDQTGQNLRHKTRCITRDGEKLWFVGAGDLWEDHINLDDITRAVPEHECRIILAHNPDTADTKFETRVDLMISGHTHGGQVNIPFLGTPVLPVKNKNYSFGLKKSNKGFPLFISKGIGWALYPVRFNCFPEIAVLELTRARISPYREPGKI